ncbi:MAG: type II secretion system protein GspG [Phycisphaerales bacterium]|nr:type II secretion system protein GspG [Phycisphaerales bacterium]
MNKAASVARAGARAFSLMEMMLVVVIIGILATVVVVNLAGGADEARRGATVTTISQVKGAITTYYTKYGSYPVTLDVLATGSPALLEKVPNDAWSNPLVYIQPSDIQGKAFNLYSLGQDKQGGTADDINVWTMDQPQ